MSPQWNQQLEIANGCYACFNIGDLQLIIAKSPSGWDACFNYDKQADVAQQGELRDLPANLRWQKWLAHSEDSKVCLQPALPPLSVIARSEHPLIIPPGVKARFYIGIPLFVELQAECGGSMSALDCVPSEILSYSWKGELLANGNSSTTRGEVCYALPKHTQRAYEVGEFAANKLVCSFEVVNKRSEAVPFARIVLNGAHFSVFQAEHNLWTNSCRLVIARDSSLDGLIISPTPPAESAYGQELRMPREGKKRRLIGGSALDMLTKGFDLSI